ncbi:MAG: HRDC domain-containing protein [Bacteroidia bacterium]|nr:HRDC domain-containing protein [Bacteroidia bacterium]
MTPSTLPQADLKTEAIQTLQTVQALNQRYGTSYLVDILRGNNSFGLRKQQHADIDTYGCMKDRSADYVRRLINLLTRENYLSVINTRYGILGLTEAGQAFLNKPAPLEIERYAMNESAYDREMRRQLRMLRKQFAMEEDKPPYRIFTDFALEEMLALKPTTVEDLLTVSGVGHYKANRYGLAIIRLITNMEAGRDEFYFQQNLRKALTPSHQAVKHMFEAGHTIEEIANHRAVKPATVHSTLYSLHQAGQVDLKPWIENTLPEEDLQKGAAWFEQHENPKLRDAYEQLGLDYDTLRFCRLYVAGTSSFEVDLAKAS